MVRRTWTSNSLAYRRRPEVGQPVLPRLLPKSASTIIASQAYPLSQCHVHRESCRPAICGYSRRLLPLQWRLLPEEGLWTTSTPAMGLRDRSATGWVSAQRENLSPVTPRAKGHGGVYRRGSPTGLHPPFYLPCCFKFLFCGQEGRRLAALYRLPVTEQYYSEIPLSTSSRPCSPGESPWCHYLHQAGPPQRVQPHQNTWGGRVEDCLRDPYWPLRIFGYAVWPSQRPLRISGLHARGAPRVLVYIDDILIYSWSLAEYRHHVAVVLQRLRQLHLFLKAEKCSFHQPSVQFLGYHIDSSCIRMDEGKVEAIKTWLQPTTIKELPTLPEILQLLPPLHTELQYPYQSTHKLTPQQAQVSVLVHSRQWSFREVKDVFHPSSHPRSSWSRETLHCGSRCFHHGCGSHPFPAAGESI